MDKHLPVLYQGVTVLEIFLSLPERLHFRAHKGDPRFIGIFYKVVQPRRLILGDNFSAVFLCAILLNRNL
jgi:hypothetical protein